MAERNPTEIRSLGSWAALLRGAISEKLFAMRVKDGWAPHMADIDRELGICDHCGSIPSDATERAYHEAAECVGGIERFQQ